MYEDFGIQVFGPALMVTAIVATFGGLVAQHLFGPDVGGTYMDKTFRVLLELLGGQGLIWTALFFIDRLVPAEYLDLVIVRIAQAVVLVAATLVVRQSGFFADFLPSLRRRNEQDTNNTNQPPREG